MRLSRALKVVDVEVPVGRVAGRRAYDDGGTDAGWCGGSGCGLRSRRRKRSRCEDEAEEQGCHFEPHAEALGNFVTRHSSSRAGCVFSEARLERRQEDVNTEAGRGRLMV